MGASNFFCIFFTFEWLVRLFAFDRKRDALQDGWFRFDMFLVFTMILDTWIIMTAQKFQSGGNQISIPVQPLRMVRLAKLSRMARLMKVFPELVTMFKGLLGSFRAISSAGILVGLMVYIWAILLHTLLKHEDERNKRWSEEYDVDFSTIPLCMWALLAQGTLMMDNSARVMTELLFADKSSVVIAGIFFLIHMILSALLILQMLIGVMCDVVARVGADQRDALAIGILKQELLELITKFSTEKGKISQPDLLKVMRTPSSVAVLKKLNINRLFLMELQKLLFPKLDSTVSIKAVMALMLQCRGDNTATVESLSRGFCFLASELDELKDETLYKISELSHHAVHVYDCVAPNQTIPPKPPPPEASSRFRGALRH